MYLFSDLSLFNYCYKNILMWNSLKMFIMLGSIHKTVTVFSLTKNRQVSQSEGFFYQLPVRQVNSCVVEANPKHHQICN